MPVNTSPPQTGALLEDSAWTIHRRVIGALLIREMLTRYGRNNIGFLWLFLEPIFFIIVVAAVWSATRTIHGTTLPVVGFAVTGYSSLLLWRHTVSRCIGAVKSNKALLYHRRVTILDIFTARILLEIVSITTTLVVLTLIMYSLDLITLPEDLLKVMAGWALLSWFTAGLAMTVGGLSEKMEVVGRFWHPFSYLLMIFSGVAFVVEIMPPATQKYLLWVPMLNAVEFIRDGWFGSMFTAHYDLGYLVDVNIGLTLVGLILVRQIGFDSSDE
jgi:ABC-2 type transport system permease protein/capsular polysaccharide transport system permease protein